MTDKEELTRGEALARVAVLEAELAELRQRVCVPDVSTMARVLSDRVADARNIDLTDNWAMYGEEYIEDVRAMLAAHAPVERCDTCHGHGEVPTGETQRFGDLQPPEPIMMACPECDGEAPVERVEQDAVSYYERAHGEKSPTHGMSLDERIAHVEGRTNAAGYMEFGSVMAVSALIDHVLRDSPAPRPAPTACTGKNCGSTDPNLHSADCFAEHEQAIAPTAAQDVAGLVGRIVPRIDAGGPNPIDPDVHCCEWTLYNERERIHAEFSDALAAHQQQEQPHDSE